MELKPSSGAAPEELERLTESGVLAGFVILERAGQTGGPVLVRPVIGDGLAGWMPDLERLLGVVKGVVGVSGTNMAEAAGVAADAAAWLGDRGRTVVLVDAVVERPVLGKALYEDRDEGLVDAVLFGVSRGAVVRRTLAPGVSVVTAGSHPLSVNSVFEAAEFSTMLRALAEDALVLVLVPPTYVSKILGVLDAAVCVAGTRADIASLASCTGGVRTTGILVREQSEAAVDPEESGGPAEPPALVLPTRDDSGRPAETEAQVGEASPEHAELGRQESETGREGTEEPGLTPIVIGASSRGRRRSSNRVAATAAVLVIVAIATLLWWFVDGEHRFGSRPGGSVRPGLERVVEARDSETPEDHAVTPGEMGEAARTDEGADREAADAHGEGPSGGGRTTAEGREASLQEISAGGDDSAMPPTREWPDGDTIISGPGGPYRIMVSSHRYEGAAVFEAGQLIERGVAAEVVATEVEDRGIWFRVVVSGGYPRLSGAREVLDTIKTLGYEGAWIERAVATSDD